MAGAAGDAGTGTPSPGPWAALRKLCGTCAGCHGGNPGRGVPWCRRCPGRPGACAAAPACAIPAPGRACRPSTRPGASVAAPGAARPGRCARCRPARPGSGSRRCGTTGGTRRGRPSGGLRRLWTCCPCRARYGAPRSWAGRRSGTRDARWLPAARPNVRSGTWEPRPHPAGTGRGSRRKGRAARRDVRAGRRDRACANAMPPGAASPWGEAGAYRRECAPARCPGGCGAGRHGEGPRRTHGPAPGAGPESGRPAGPRPAGPAGDREALRGPPGEARRSGGAGFRVRGRTRRQPPRRMPRVPRSASSR